MALSEAMVAVAAAAAPSPASAVAGGVEHVRPTAPIRGPCLISPTEETAWEDGGY